MSDGYQSNSEYGPMEDSREHGSMKDGHLLTGLVRIDRLCGLVVRVSGYRYRGPGFDPRRYRIFWVAVGLERGPLSLVSWVNEKSSGSRSRKQRLTAVGTRCADHVTPLYPQKLALTSPTGGGRSVGKVSVRTKATQLYTIYVPIILAIVIITYYVLRQTHYLYHNHFPRVCDPVRPLSSSSTFSFS